MYSTDSRSCCIPADYDYTARKWLSCLWYQQQRPPRTEHSGFNEALTGISQRPVNAKHCQIADLGGGGNHLPQRRRVIGFAENLIVYTGTPRFSPHKVGSSRAAFVRARRLAKPAISLHVIRIAESRRKLLDCRNHYSHPRPHVSGEGQSVYGGPFQSVFRNGGNDGK